MLYFLIKLPIRLALLLFCREVRVRNKALTAISGPVLITANHPDSFLDAIIIGSRFRRPVYFLARGDAFRKPWQAGLLRLLNMIPVYRMSEGKENLHRNSDAFERCKHILSQNGMVLIFIEGISINSHELQPFKKGAARIAIENKALGTLKILPLGIAYDSLSGLGKTVQACTGNAIPVDELLPFDEDAKNIHYFNRTIFPQVAALIDIPGRASPLAAEKILLSVPAMIGYILHLPLYAAINAIVTAKTKGTIFYDSVLFATLFVCYPLYLLLLGFILCQSGLSYLWIVTILILHPLLARCVLLYK